MRNMLCSSSTRFIRRGKNGLSRHPKTLVPFCKPDIARYIHSVVNAAQKGHVGPGPLVAEAQKALTEMIGGGPALLTTSGTVALQLGTISLFGLPTHWANAPDDRRACLWRGGCAQCFCKHGVPADLRRCR